MTNSINYQIDFPHGVTITGSSKSFVGPVQGLPLRDTEREFGVYHKYDETVVATPFFSTYYQRPSEVVKKPSSIERGIGLRIRHLKNYALREPLDIILQADGPGFLASSVDLPLYGYGDDMVEAIDILKEEIEDVYDELLEDDNFTKEWLKIKTFLSKVINTNHG